ncbi:trichome birefringence-like [Striga asiatica]|uniref:Trichome birefringence-like n=1 Tax=Striga asiatica TaxID=4170 RepID=A0A5A7RKA6_STRAF|nr:trichome birefringence-like [Striga asiatica]
MVEKIVCDWKSWLRSPQKNKYSVLILGAVILAVGLAFRLIYSNSPFDISLLSSTSILGKTHVSPSPVISVTSQEVTDQNTTQELFDSEGKCNLFVGDWVPYEGQLLYTNNSCSFIGGHQDCMKNGRPDRDYLHWRWKPHACDLPRLHPKKFLQLMRNKTWAFIGDSINRNHAQSFMCILSTVEKAIEVYHDEEYKSYRWVFPSHNLTVWNLWSPLLAKAAIFEDINGVSTSEIELHLDILDDSWTQYYSTFDYMIFSVGSWFPKSTIYYENSLAIGCNNNCPKRNLTELGFKFAYQKVLHNVFDFIVQSNHKEGVVLYRTTTPDHYEGGEWYNGGTCNRSLPVKEGVFEVNGVYRILRDVEMEEFGEARVRAKESGVNFGLMDVGPLALMRPDGHPGPYRFFQPFAGSGGEKKVISDCLHWCMPGPIDAWNDVLMEMVVRG